MEKEKKMKWSKVIRKAVAQAKKKTVGDEDCILCEESTTRREDTYYSPSCNYCPFGNDLFKLRGGAHLVPGVGDEMLKKHSIFHCTCLRDEIRNGNEEIEAFCLSIAQTLEDEDD